MPMKNPPHPGHSIKDACLEPLGLSVTQAADVLGIARHTLSRVLNGRAGISPEMAIRLEKAGWSNADPWMRVQTAYDLAPARRMERLGLRVRSGARRDEGGMFRAGCAC
jgi:addiction module HigA family antidote